MKIFLNFLSFVFLNFLLFSFVILVPELFRKMRETCAHHFHLVALKSELECPSYDQKTELCSKTMQKQLKTTTTTTTGRILMVNPFVKSRDRVPPP